MEDFDFESYNYLKENVPLYLDEMKIFINILIHDQKNNVEAIPLSQKYGVIVIELSKILNHINDKSYKKDNSWRWCGIFHDLAKQSVNMPPMTYASRNVIRSVRRIEDMSISIVQQSRRFFDYTKRDDIRESRAQNIPPDEKDRINRIYDIIKYQSETIYIMSLSLHELIDSEIKHMNLFKPNDEIELKNWMQDVDFLNGVLSLLSAINTSLEEIMKDRGCSKEISKYASLISRLNDHFGGWIANNGSELVDSSTRIALIGIGTGFLSFCGAPVAGAFGLSAAFVGGAKAINVLTTLSKK